MATVQSAPVPVSKYDGCMTSDRKRYNQGVCIVDGCSNANYQTGYRCRYHAAVERGLVCSFDGCDKPLYVKKLALCSGHYQQHLAGKELRPLRDPSQFAMRHITTSGYVSVKRPDHPCANNAGYVPEHRLVMEDYLGRLLEPHEEVHHKNGDRADNELHNLELWSTKQPKGQRVEDKVAWAREILEQYEPELGKHELLRKRRVRVRAEGKQQDDKAVASRSVRKVRKSARKTRNSVGG